MFDNIVNMNSDFKGYFDQIIFEILFELSKKHSLHIRTENGNDRRLKFYLDGAWLLLIDFLSSGKFNIIFSIRKTIIEKLPFVECFPEQCKVGRVLNNGKDGSFQVDANNINFSSEGITIYRSLVSDYNKGYVEVVGVIRSPNSYSDGSRDASIEFAKNLQVPCAKNPGMAVNLDINGEVYVVNILVSDGNPNIWTNPSCIRNGVKERLSTVLYSIGLKTNDKVRILFNGNDGKLIHEQEVQPIIKHSESEITNSQKNLILFGPPGTGKTYNTIDEALNILDQDYLHANCSKRKLLKDRFDQLLEVGRIRFVTFHQSFSYEDFVEGLKAESQEDGSLCYKVVDGLFKQICQRAEEDPDNPYVLIIDEINRGNISRIFGELITLLETSKRLGAEEELTVQLPNSKDEKLFGVPGNLYVIGTMNTADRSLAGLDLALRRRFFFKEMPPRPELLDQVVVDGVPIGELLRIINRRITALLGRDYCLGHAIFMPLCDDGALQRLATIFQKQVLPLLQEYFFEDWQKIALVLNDHRKSGNTRFVVEDKSLDLIALFGPEEGEKMNNLPTGWLVCDEVDPVWISAGAYLGTIGHTEEESVA
ncbi:TPA: AAA family ATPase [Aeromonas sobria]|nr:AAA family ATPase [Aeromonas sobria]